MTVAEELGIETFGQVQFRKFCEVQESTPEERAKARKQLSMDKIKHVIQSLRAKFNAWSKAHPPKDWKEIDAHFRRQEEKYKSMW